MLREMDWKILARNWRSGHLELDIVAEDHDTLVFVEVKTRASGGMQRPYEALTAAKKKRLIRAAQAWQAAHDAWSRPCRFDLICVTVGADSCQMELIRNVIEYGEQNPGTLWVVGTPLGNPGDLSPGHVAAWKKPI